MRFNDGMKSSVRDDWATPGELFRALDAEFGFTLDAASTHDNALCPRHFTVEDDALVQDWTGRVWLNPPYGRAIAPFMAKASAEVENGNAEVVVCLVPARTDTRWWWESVMPYYPAGVRFIRGRLKFGGHDNCAPFPSAIVVMSRAATCEEVDE